MAEKLTIEEKKLQQRMMQTMFHKAITLPEVKAAIKKASVSPKPFVFEEYKSAYKAITKVLRTYSKQIDSTILSGIEEAWKQGDNGLWREIGDRLAKTEAEQTLFNTIRKESTTAHRGTSAKEFHLKESQDGKTISTRIWKNVEQSKTDLEIIIQNGIKEGRSADDMARETQKYLKDPDKLFRRIKNPETGKLELSDAARKYKPGQGKYRSSYKNALRLVSNEINRAYRESTWLNMQDNPLVIGYEIRLSNNHTCSDGKGGLIPNWTDICDELQGKYPKWFKWTGWHVNCRCRIILILIDNADFASLIKANAQDMQDEWSSKKTLKDVPEALNKWLSNNADRISKASSKPYWIQDNFK